MTGALEDKKSAGKNSTGGLEHWSIAGETLDKYFSS